MRKIISLLLSITLLLGLNTVTVTARTISSNKIHTSMSAWEDGGYIITTITETPTDSTHASFLQSKIKTGSKRSDYYNANNILQFSVFVEGTFTYNGQSANATNAKGRYSINSRSWTFVSGSTLHPGATATFRATFRNSNNYNQNLSVTLSCSPDGTLS